MLGVPANNLGNQNLKMVSRGDGYNLQLNGVGLSIGATSNLPNTSGVIPLSTQATNVNNNNQFFYFDNLDATNSKFLLRLKSNTNFCVNVPNSAQNVPVNLVLCNGSQVSQVWRQQYVGGNPAYVQPMPNGATGVLESAAGKRVVLQNLVNGGQLGSITPNGVSAGQVFKFTWNGFAYTIARDGTTFGISSTGLDYIGLNNNPMSMHAYSNTGGRYGSFGFTNLGNGFYQVRSFFFPKYCLSTGGTVPIMALCNVNDLSQKITFGQNRTVLEEVNPVYKIYLASLRPTANIFDASGETGHSWIGLVKFYSQDEVVYQNNIQVSRIRKVDGLTRVSTLSSTGPNPSNYYIANDQAEINRTNLLINNSSRKISVPGASIGYDTRGGNYFGSNNRTISFLERTISQEKYNKFLPTILGGLGSTQNCNSYALITTTTSTNCSCSSLALRIFQDAFANTLDLDGLENVVLPNYPQPVVITTITPLGLSKDIDRINGYSDWDSNR